MGKEMNKLETMKAIDNFWTFFEVIADQLTKEPENLELISILDDKVVQTLGLDWEIGPTDEGLYFCLSPKLDDELIDKVKLTISRAPSISNWDFIVGKPKKLELIEEFVILDDDESEINISTRGWRVIVYKYKDSTCDIDVLMDNALNKDLQYIALDIALTNMLGELNYMQKIGKAAVVEEFDNETNKIGIEFIHLNNVLGWQVGGYLSILLVASLASIKP